MRIKKARTQKVVPGVVVVDNHVEIRKLVTILIRRIALNNAGVSKRSDVDCEAQSRRGHSVYTHKAKQKQSTFFLHTLINISAKAKMLHDSRCVENTK